MDGIDRTNENARRFSFGAPSAIATPLEELPSEVSAGISVVVPVYNSEQTLKILVDRLLQVLPTCTTQFEIVFVNDGSRDRSWTVVCELASRYSWVCGINLMRNYGQHNALLCGVLATSFDTIVTLDDDLQHPPEEIPKLLDKLNEGCDVVYGAPEHEQHGLWRNLASRLTKFALQGVMGVETARHVSAFRAFRQSASRAFPRYQSPFVSIDVLLTWATSRFTHVTVRRDARSQGRSNYTFRSLIVHALNMLTGFSSWPLKLAGAIGFAFTFFGLVLLVYVVGRYIMFGSTVAGFTFLASVIVIFSGAQLVTLGIIGEYLSRVHLRTMDRPAFLIRETTQSESSRNDVCES